MSDFHQSVLRYKIAEAIKALGLGEDIEEELVYEISFNGGEPAVRIVRKVNARLGLGAAYVRMNGPEATFGELADTAIRNARSAGLI